MKANFQRTPCRSILPASESWDGRNQCTAKRSKRDEMKSKITSSVTKRTLPHRKRLVPAALTFQKCENSREESRIPKKRDTESKQKFRILTLSKDRAFSCSSWIWGMASAPSTGGRNSRKPGVTPHSEARTVARATKKCSTSSSTRAVSRE